MSNEQPVDNYGIAHHGHPILTEQDGRLLLTMLLWIQTVRATGKFFYSETWLPSGIDIRKSRLFWRLRSGKAPLPEPPPTCFSCPWYEIVEVDEPHDIYDVHSFPKDGSRSKNVIVVGQCAYEVISKADDGSMIVGFGRWRFKLWRDEVAWRAAHPSRANYKFELKPHECWWIQRVQWQEAR